MHQRVRCYEYIVGQMNTVPKDSLKKSCGDSEEKLFFSVSNQYNRTLHCLQRRTTYTQYIYSVLPLAPTNMHTHNIYVNAGPLLLC